MKKHLKKQAATIIIASMALSGGAVYADQAEEAVVTSAEVTSTQVTASQYNVLVNNQAIATAGFINKDNHIMIPLREVSEALGFDVKWHQDTQAAEVVLPESPIWTLVKPGVDQYAYNKMNKTLGAAPVNLQGKMYVPASFFAEILRSNVTYEGNQVNISLQEEKVEMVTQQGVITSINNDEKYKSIQINGAGVEGTILNIDEATVIRNSAGEKVDLSALALGMKIEAKHSLAMTMSLPGQTYAYEITALEAANVADTLGTSGVIQEVRQDEAGNISIAVKGMGMSDVSPEEVVLGINDATILVDLEGNAIKQEQLKQGAKVLAYYGPVLTKSLPPIGQALKVVYLGQEEA